VLLFFYDAETSHGFRPESKGCCRVLYAQEEDVVLVNETRSL
jgi:hypothetical protein